MQYSIHAPTPDWSEVKRLAARLGVSPLVNGDTAAVTITVDGKHGEPATQYDLMALIHGVLDKLDAAERTTQKPITHF